MRQIEICDELYDHLQRHARAFEDTPDSVLRRLLGLEGAHAEGNNGQNMSPRKRTPTERGPIHGLSDPERMRQDAKKAIEAALTSRGLPTSLSQASQQSGRKGPREQRYKTPRGQVLYLRTRSFEPEKPPFFSASPESIDDADWYVFWADGRGAVVMPGAELRRYRSGLYVGGGICKPTFVIEGASCELYVGGTRVPVTEHLNGFDAIARAEERLTDTRNGGSTR